MELLVHIQQGSSQLPHLTLFPVPLHCSLLIPFLSQQGRSCERTVRITSKCYWMCGGPCAASHQVRGDSALPTLRGQEQCHGAPPGSDLPGGLQKVTLHYSKGLTCRKPFPCELTAAASCSEALLQPSVSFSCLCTDAF